MKIIRDFLQSLELEKEYEKNPSGAVGRAIKVIDKLTDQELYLMANKALKHIMQSEYTCIRYLHMDRTRRLFNILENDFELATLNSVYNSIGGRP